MNRFFLNTLLLFAIIILCTSNLLAQTNNRFYASIEDYQNDKWIEDIEIQSNTWEKNLGVESFNIISLNSLSRKILNDLPSKYFKYDDMLIKIYKKHCYIVLVYGNLCLYSLYSLNQKQYYSEGITGKFKKYKSKNLKKHLIKYDLLDKYKQAKPNYEISDDANTYYLKRIKREVDFFNLINEKIK